jgi:hypothetical protein
LGNRTIRKLTRVARRIPGLAWILLAMAAAAQTPPAQVAPPAGHLKVDASPSVVIREGSGAADFKLANDGPQPIPLDLKADAFVDATAHTELAKPKITFTAVPGGASLPSLIPAHQTIEIKAQVTDFTGASEATAALFNGATEIGQLEASAIDVPLNISIDGAGTADKSLAFTEDNDAILSLKNGDAEAYPLHWQLLLDGHVIGEAETSLPPNGIARIPLKPNPGAYSLTDWIHPATKTGTLVLKLQKRDNFPDAMLPVRQIPVTLDMSPSSPTWSVFRSYLYVAIILLLGGLLSLLGSSLLPNLLRKISLRSQIADLANRTSSISTRVDSYLRVLLRLERKKIDILLQEAGLLSLTEGEVFDQVAVAIYRLTKRLVIAERMDELWRRFETACATAPPSLTNEVDKTLQAAAEQLHSFSLPEDDLTAGNKLLDKANDSLDLLDNTDALAKRIADNFRQLQARKAIFPLEYYADLQESLAGVFGMLDRDYGNVANLTKEMFFAVDHAVAAIHAALDYAIVRASTASDVTRHCDDAGQLARERLIKRECELVNLLGTLSWNALREATILVQEMREDIYVADVLDELGRDRQAEVVFDTQKARPYLPVFFSICFKDPRFNGAAAIKRVSSHWNFPNELIENGWKVCHFFEAADTDEHKEHKVTIEAVVRSRRNPEQQKVLKHQIAVQPRAADRQYSRLFAEAVQFFIAFGVALAGLLSGALEQLGKLDFLPATIAILALGFGADSIKNLLTKAAKKSP